MTTNGHNQIIVNARGERRAVAPDTGALALMERAIRQAGPAGAGAADGPDSRRQARHLADIWLPG